MRPATARFAVIIPTFNRAPFLRRSLASLAEQTCQDFEVHVCDDGSTDDSSGVVREYSGAFRVRYHRNEHWGGPARPRNIGIAAAEAPWICFLDSDDWWLPGKLEACLPHLGDQDVLYHCVQVASSEGMTGGLIGRDLRRPVFNDLLANLNAIPNSAAVIRTELVRRIGGLSEDPGIIGVEDFDLWLRVARHTERFLRVSGTLGAYFDAGPGHNLSASERQIANERRVFDRYRSYLPAADRDTADRQWGDRRERLQSSLIRMNG